MGVAVQLAVSYSIEMAIVMQFTFKSEHLVPQSDDYKYIFYLINSMASLSEMFLPPE